MNKETKDPTEKGPLCRTPAVPTVGNFRKQRRMEVESPREERAKTERGTERVGTDAMGVIEKKSFMACKIISFR